ncbi:MAG: CDP-glucose 4,6-dehydratase, partial [Planctomycetota bacterium]|nr:CDP-glucose 4,6-dehydratase [Planctomycetota bacterium]
LWGKGSYKVIPNKKLHEAKLLNLDITKAKSLLKWQPRINIHDTLGNTIKWYKRYYSKSSMLSETINQIRNYYGR